MGRAEVKRIVDEGSDCTVLVRAGVDSSGTTGAGVAHIPPFVAPSWHQKHTTSGLGAIQVGVLGRQNLIFGVGLYAWRVI